MRKFSSTGQSLFDWADAQQRTRCQSPLANHIQRRCSITPLHARLVEELLINGGAHE